MSRMLKLGLPAVALFALLACTPTPEGPVAPKPAPTPAELVGQKLASVNGQELGTAGWEAAAERKVPADGKSWSDAEKKEILDAAIGDELLFQEAFNRAIYQDPKVRRILTNLLLRAEIYDKVTAEQFTDADLQAYFDAHIDEFVIPEKVQLRRIFVAVSDQREESAARAIALTAYEKVKVNPDAFRDIAMTTSEDAFARRGGDIGFLDRNGRAGIPTEVVDRAFQLAEGEITEPFLAGGGFNIVSVPSRRERVERTFDQMKGSVLRRVKNEKYEQLSQEFINGLKTKAAVSVDEAAIAAWNPTPPARPGAGGGFDAINPNLTNGLAPSAPIQQVDPNAIGHDAEEEEVPQAEEQ